MTERNKILNKILKLYKELLPLLEKHKIDFSANGGTCIGACREKGFIEWDDDMDINIFPWDNDKLIKLLDELPDNLEYSFHDKGIVKIYHKKLMHKGKKVFIDLMTHEYVRKLNFIQLFIAYCLTAHFYYNGPNHDNPKYKIWYLKWFVRITTFWIPTKFTRFLFQKLLRTKKEKYVSQITNINWYRATIHERSFFKKRVKVPFEDTYIYVLKNYNDYLTKVYGNWKTPVDWEQDHFE